MNSAHSDGYLQTDEGQETAELELTFYQRGKLTVFYSNPVGLL